jgi:hypothetical protein
MLMNRTLGFFFGIVLLLASRSLPALAQEPVKCGFSEVAALHAAAAHDAHARSLLKAAMERPALPSNYVTADGRFKIHYTTTGANAVSSVSTNPDGVPDFVYEAGRTAQRAYALLVDSLGMRPAASDNGMDGPEFDFYIDNRPNLEYGRTNLEFVGEGSGPAYILIDNDFGPGYYSQGLNGLRVTVAHEYFHAVQLNYYFRGEDLYFFEISSVWFEDYAYDSINDYFAYLPRWFRDPELPLNTSDGSHEYGSSIWLHYLTERLATVDVIPDLWERVVNEPAVFATRYVLQSQPYSLPIDQAVQEFYNWCFFTNYRADTDNYFSEGQNYPLIPFDPSNSFRITDDASYAAELPPLAARFYRFIRAGLDLQYRLQVDTEPGRWGLTTITAGANEAYVLQSDRALATIRVAAQGREDTVFAAIANVGLPPNSNQAPAADYQLQIGVGGQLDLQNILEKPRPNPVRFSRGDILKIPYRINARVEVEAFICGEDGRVIWSKNYGPQTAGPHEVVWNGVSNDGDRPGSGVYFMRLIAGDFVESAKFVLINQ